MRKVTTKSFYEKNKWWGSRWQLFTVVLASLLFCSVQVKAQLSNIAWEASTPSLNEETLTVLSNEVSYRMYFTPGVDVTNAKLEITLPAGITYKDYMAGASHASSEYTVSASGQKVTVAFSEKLLSGKSVDLSIELNVAFDASNGEISTKLSGNGTEVTKTTSFLTQKPFLKLGATTDMLDFGANYATPKQFAVDVTTTNGSLHNFELRLTYSKYVKLENFKFDGAAVTPAATVASGDNLVTRLTLTNQKIGATLKKLTFDASATRCGVRTVTVTGQYPTFATPYGETNPSKTLTMKINDVAGAVTITYKGGETGFVKGLGNGDRTTMIPAKGVPMDGTTKSYFRVSYKNTGSADAHNIEANTSFTRDALTTYWYVDLDNIYYSIEGGAPQKFTAVKNENTEVIDSLVDSRVCRLKSAYKGKPYKIKISLPETCVIPAGKTLDLYYGVAGGDIYDNSSWDQSTILEPALFTTMNFFVYNITANDACGNVGSIPSNTYGAGSPFESPRILAGASPVTLFSGESGEMTFPFRAGESGTLDVYVQLPDWLELEDSNPITWRTYTPAATTVSAGLYKVTLPSVTGDSNLTVKYKVKGVQLADKGPDTIKLWVDWSVGSPVSKLEYFTQLFQTVNLKINQTGVKLDNVTPFRITRGYKDSNKNGVVDAAGVLALDTEINHNLFLPGDKGEIRMEATVQADAVGHNYLYVPITADFNLSGNPVVLSAATVTINGTPTSGIALTKIDDQSYYLKHSVAFAADDKIVISIPFEAKGYFNMVKTITGKCYLSANEAISDVLNPGSEGKGYGNKSFPIGVYGQNFYRNNVGNKIVTGNSFAEYYWPSFVSYYANGLLTPYFEHEVRWMAKPEKYTFNLPAGYVIKDDSLKVILTEVQDEAKGKSLRMLPSSKVEQPDGSFDYTYNLTQLFCDHTDDVPDSAYPTSKWVYSDDKFTYDYALNIQATKAASSIGKKIIGTTHYLNALKNTSESLSRSFNLTYQGDATTLSVSQNQVTVTNPNNVNIPLVSIGNPNAFALQDVWLYLDGANVKDISLNGVSGTGFENRWYHVGNLPVQQNTYDYANLSFKYTGTGATDETIKIYTVSGFNSALADPSGSALNKSDIDHVGGFAVVVLKPAVTVVSGSLSLSNANLVNETTPYDLIAVLNSEASDGILADASMKITVPKGQKYNGVVTVEYPKGSGTYLTIPQTLTDALTALTGENTEHNFYFKASDFGISLPGSSESDLNKKNLVLKVQFMPTCNTEFTRFTGELSAAGSAKGKGRIVGSPVLKAAGLSSSYSFTVDASTTTDIAYNEVKKEGVVKVVFSKVGGNTIPVKAGDVLRLKLPKALSLKTGGNVAQTSSDLGLSGNVAGSAIAVTPDADNSYITIKLPVDAFNGAAQYGAGSAVTYQIPVTYDPSADVNQITQPEKNVDIEILTDFSFGTCSPNPAPVGNTQLGVALIKTNSPYTAFVGTGMAFTIQSMGDFSGLWYKTDKTTAISGGAYTAVATEVGSNQDYYFSAIFGTGNTDYGKVPVKVNVYPELTLTTTATTVCQGSTLDLATLVSGAGKTNADAGKLTITYYAPDGTSLGTNSSVTVNATGVYKVEVATLDSLHSSGQRTITVNSVVPASFTTNLAAIPALFEGDNLSLSVTATGGTISYQWYKGDVLITGATSATYTKTNATTADGAEYHVTITNSPCASVTSDKITVKVYPKVTITATNTIVCRGTAVDLTSLVTGDGKTNAAASKVDIVYYGSDQSTVIATPTAVTPTTTTDYYVEVKTTDAAKASGKQKITVTVNQPATITTAPVAPAALDHNATLTLTVAATGTGTLTYEWTKDNVVIAGSNSATYTVANATYANSGSYKVKVSNACGDIESTAITVTVYPDLTLSGGATTICKGDPAVDLTSLVSGAGKTNATAGRLNIVYYASDQSTVITTPTAVSPIITTDYYVEVKTTDAAKASGKQKITVTVNQPPAITTAPVAPAALDHNATLTLTVAATGTGTLTYEWTKDNVVIAGSNSATYTVANATYANSGSYKVKVSNACGDIESTAITVTVYPDLTLTANNQTICKGDPAVDLTSLVTGAGKTNATAGRLNIVYYESDQSTVIATPTTVSPIITTDYYVEVKTTDAAKASGKQKITVTVNQPATITTHPKTISVNRGKAINLSVVAAGTGTLSYQWYKNNTAITTNGTSDTYAIPISAITDAGNYTVEVAASDCSTPITSNIAVVTVLSEVTPPVEAPVFTQSLSGSADLCPSDNYRMTVAATSDATLYYEWYVNGTPIAGASSNSYTVTNDGVAQSGIYSVKVSNWAGGVTSSMNINMKSTVGTIAISGLPSLPKAGVPYRISSTKVAGAVYTWNFSGGTITVKPTSEPNQFDITFSQKGNGKLSVTVNTGCGVADGIESIELDIVQGEIGVGIEDVQVSTLLVYPNPVETELIIKSTKGMIRKVKISTMNGYQAYVQQGLNVSELRLDTSSWTQVGTYIVIVETDKGTTVHKIIKK